MANLLRLPEVSRKTGLSRSAIYRNMNEGTFPKQIPIGSKTVGWLEEELEDWINRKKERARRLAVIQSENNGAIYQRVSTRESRQEAG